MQPSFSIFALLLLVAPAAVFAALPSKPPAPYVPGEVIVKYRDAGRVAAGTGTGGSAAETIPDVRERLRAMGLQVRRQLLDGRADLMALPATMDVPGAVRALAAEEGVEYVEPNYLRYTMQSTPNDDLFGDLWGLHNTGQDNFVSGGPAGVMDGDLNMLPAWDPAGDGTFTRTGDSSVIVAIIDDAFDTDHPDLVENFTDGNDLTDDGTTDSTPDNSDQSHGTLVAGSLGARGNNSKGVAGTTWFSSLMPLKVGSGDGLSSAAISSAIDFARDNNADVINASFGGPGFSSTEKSRICNLDDDDILFVSSAGNDDANMDFGRIGYPALYDCSNIVAVAATNRQDNIASFSMYGPVSVDVAAPGLQIVTTEVDGGYFTAGEGGVSGTSFSAPYTAGIAALLRWHVPTNDENEIKARLIESGASLGNATERVAGGRIDAAAALDMSPRPSLTIENVTIQNVADRLVPGQTVDIQVTLANGWEDATSVTWLQSADGPVTVTSTNRTTFGSGFIPSNGTESDTFRVEVSSTADGHNYVSFTLDIEADGGYAASRRFIREIAPLAHDGTVVEQRFHTDTGDSALESRLYDEYHTWHVAVDSFDLPSPTPDNRYTLSVRTETPADTDIDLLGLNGTPPKYLITLNADINDPNTRSFFCTSSTTVDCRDPDTRVSGRSDGHEAVTHVFDGGSVPEDFYFTVVNFAQDSFDYDIWAELKAGDLRPDPASLCSDSSLGENDDLCVPSSDTLTVAGLSNGAETFVYIRRGQYSVNGGDFTDSDGRVSNGDVIEVAGNAADTPELTVGGITARFDSDASLQPPPPGSGSSSDGGGGGGGCGWIGPGGKPDFLLHLLVLIASLVLLRSPFPLP